MSQPSQIEAWVRAAKEGGLAGRRQTPGRLSSRPAGPRSPPGWRTTSRPASTRRTFLQQGLHAGDPTDSAIRSPGPQLVPELGDYHRRQSPGGRPPRPPPPPAETSDAKPPISVIRIGICWTRSTATARFASAQPRRSSGRGPRSPDGLSGPPSPSPIGRCWSCVSCKPLPITEVAERIGRSDDAVVALTRRALDALRTAMDNLGEFTRGG